MPNYRRLYVPGGLYFFTVVTHGCEPMFSDPLARRLLGAAMRECLARHPARTLAIVLLPNHLHAIWELPQDDDDFPLRWRVIKRQFTRDWLASGGEESRLAAAEERSRRRGVWQRRYWEHAVRDERDFERHADYIHFNPVKHGLVARPVDWPWSSIHRWIRRGFYPADWGGGDLEIAIPSRDNV